MVISALIDTTAIEEERLRGSLTEGTEDLVSEENRLIREKERINVEQSYIAEEEKVLTEQAVEVEVLISSQTGDTTDRRTALLSQQGTCVDPRPNFLELI